tara:strand:- start:141 stop:746 length:606 start_codon:yes stop_codon:yes gene_type:complete
MKKIAIILFLSLFAVTCSGHSSTIFFKNDFKIVYKNDYCNPDRPFPQMILIPYFNQATQIVPNCNTYPVHKTALALLVFYHHWLENFGDRDMVVRGMLEKVMIKWGTEKRVSSRGYDLKGKRFKDRNIIGLVEANNIIWVWQGYHHKISESALIHELVHLALRAKNGTADPDHEGFKYRGWTSRHSRMIVQSKRMLRAFDI